MELRADFDSHHIEGYARAALERGADARFDVPLVTHIEGNLWMGGCRDGVRLPDDFDHVVSLYPWEKYELGPDTQRVEITMFDSDEVPPVDQLDVIADVICRMKAGGKTLVHCQAGLNRSGLLTAYALIKGGRAPADAIALLREKRSPVVLCNQAFEAWLLTLAPGEDS